jgi:probable phosphoglycerate mutase
VTEATRVLAIRHGETAWNVDARIQGQLDVALNDTGLWQAGRLAQAILHEPLEALYSSDLQRASHTAQAIGEATRLPVQHDARLRERSFGIFEGHTFREIEERWPDEARRWRQRDPTFGPPEGETLAAFYDRCVDAVSRLAARHAGQTIAIVAHGGVMDCLYRAALRIDLRAVRTWQLGNASINRLLHTPRGFSLIGWGDSHHLEGEAARDAGGLGPA